MVILRPAAPGHLKFALAGRAVFSARMYPYRVRVLA